MSCRVVSCHDISCRVTGWHVMSCHVMSVVPRRIVLRHATLRSVKPRFAVDVTWIHALSHSRLHLHIFSRCVLTRHVPSSPTTLTPLYCLASLAFWCLLMVPLLMMKEADGDISIITNSSVSNSVINTSSLIIRNNQHHQQHQERHPHDRQPLAGCGVTVSTGLEYGSKAAENTRVAGSQKATRRLEKPSSRQGKNNKIHQRETRKIYPPYILCVVSERRCFAGHVLATLQRPYQIKGVVRERHPELVVSN